MARRSSGGPSEGLGALLGGLARTRVSANMLTRFPSGRWGFEAGTHADLGFERTDGLPLTPEDLRAIQQHGPGVVKNVRKRTWPTESAAIEAAEALGASVSSFTPGWIHPKDRPAMNRKIASAMADAVVEMGMRPLQPRDAGNLRAGDRLRCWRRDGTTQELTVSWVLPAEETASGKPAVSAEGADGSGINPLAQASRCLVYPRKPR